jgi:glycosyltransferase involved in cell wall biosynthesis
LRVLQVHTHYRQSGGEDGVVATEAKLLRSAGHDVRTWTEHNLGGPRAAVQLAATQWNVRAANRLRGAVRAFRPDIAHVHNTWFAMGPAVIHALRSLDVPVVMTLHNYRLLCAAATLYRDGAPCEDCVGSHPWHGVQHLCYRDSMVQSAAAAATIAWHGGRGTWSRDVDLFLALSEFGRRRFIAGGLPAAKLLVKPNSVGDPGPRENPPSTSRTVVYVGRLSKEKGVDVLLEAWSRVDNDLDLVIVGTGPLEGLLRQTAPPSVRFLGHQTPESVTTLLMTARALVFPSTWYEGQGLVAIEAAAAGLPVLLSDLGAMAEIFAPHADELLFEPGDSSALRSRLERLEEDGFVDHYGEVTRRCFDERYRHETALERLEDAYRRAASRA